MNNHMTREKRANLGAFISITFLGKKNENNKTMLTCMCLKTEG